MRALVLITWTDCENKWRSLEAVGIEVLLAQYDDRPHGRHTELVECAAGLRPDFIVHIGAVEQYHGRPVPHPHIFRQLKAIAPLIHMCNDAADDPWWPLLEEYDREDCFTVQVSIDGSHNNPIAKFSNGLLALTPIDHRVFYPKPWALKDIRCGMVGGIGHTDRFATADALIKSGHLTFHDGPVGRTYAEMAEIMCRTKVTFNYGATGSGRHKHVKGRVVEAGFAGSALLELRGSPAVNWLAPGEHYLEYSNSGEVCHLLETTSDEAFERMANNLRQRIVAQHHPRVFWSRVLDKAGVQHGLYS